MRDIDDVRRDMNDLRGIEDFWTAPGARLFGATMALLTLATLVGSALLAWLLVEWVFFPLVVTGAALGVAVYLALLLIVGTVRCCLR